MVNKHFYNHEHRVHWSAAIFVVHGLQTPDCLAIISLKAPHVVLCDCYSDCSISDLLL